MKVNCIIICIFLISLSNSLSIHIESFTTTLIKSNQIPPPSKANNVFQRCSKDGTVPFGGITGK